jgi:hypothetical protein
LGEEGRHAVEVLMQVYNSMKDWKSGSMEV